MVIKEFIKKASQDWEDKYGDKVIGFETLVEKPRTGELYIRSGFLKIGETKGYTCKRTKGDGKEKWSGKRVWNTNKENLKPKICFCIKI